MDGGVLCDSAVFLRLLREKGGRMQRVELTDEQIFQAFAVCAVCEGPIPEERLASAVRSCIVPLYCSDRCREKAKQARRAKR